MISYHNFPFWRLRLLLLTVIVPSMLHGASVIETDVCVYGGAAGGVTAAVQAARQKKTVALLVFNQHLGGMSSSGLGWTDIGNLGDSYIQGMSREFYTRVGAKYGLDKPAWHFEPHIAEAVFDGMVKEAHVAVYRGQRLAKTATKDRNITEITMDNGNVFRAKVLLMLTKAICSNWPELAIPLGGRQIRNTERNSTAFNAKLTGTTCPMESIPMLSNAPHPAACFPE